MRIKLFWSALLPKHTINIQVNKTWLCVQTDSIYAMVCMGYCAGMCIEVSEKLKGLISKQEKCAKA